MPQTAQSEVYTSVIYRYLVVEIKGQLLVERILKLAATVHCHLHWLMYVPLPGLPPPMILPDLPQEPPRSEIEPQFPSDDKDIDELYYEIPDPPIKKEPKQLTSQPLPPTPDSVTENEDGEEIYNDGLPRTLWPLPPLPPSTTVVSSDEQDRGSGGQDSRSNNDFYSNFEPISARPPHARPPWSNCLVPPPPTYPTCPLPSSVHPQLPPRPSTSLQKVPPPPLVGNEVPEEVYEEVRPQSPSTRPPLPPPPSSTNLPPLPPPMSSTKPPAPPDPSPLQDRHSTLPPCLHRPAASPPVVRPRLFSRQQETLPEQSPTLKVPHRSRSPNPHKHADKGDSDGSDAEDPYLPFKMDLESMDISKLTFEQLEQIDPRQAQLWMLLKMHQMVRKVEDVYESTEQLYSTHQAPPKLPAKPSENSDPQKNRPLKYENTTVKHPVPKPRQHRSKCEKGRDTIPVEEDATTLNKDSSESGQQEGEESKEAAKKVVKVYRKQKVIGKLSNSNLCACLRYHKHLIAYAVMLVCEGGVHSAYN